MIIETKEIFNLRGFLNRLISEKSEPPISSEKSELKSFKYLIYEVIEKIQKDYQFLKTYIKVLLNYCKKLKNEDSVHKFFLKTMIKRKSIEKLGVLNSMEYNFQSENRFIFLKYSKVSFNSQSWIFWNKYLENFFGLDSCFEIFYNFGGLHSFPFLPIKTIFFLMRKPLSFLKEIEIDLFHKILEFFLKKQIKFNGGLLVNLVGNFFKRIKEITSNSRILYILTRIETGINQKKTF